MSARKILVLAIAAAMVLTLLAACGSSPANSEAPTTAAATGATTATATTAAKQPVTVTLVTSSGGVGDGAKRGENGNYLNYIDDWNKAHPDIQVKMNYIAPVGDGSQADQKVDIMFASGNTTDIVDLGNANRYSKYISAGFIQPLDELAAANNFDIEKTFGKYAIKSNEKTYVLPSTISTNIVFYNKQMFDDAKIPYPKAGWTWDDYAEIAKKLSDPAKNIYGSIMQQWEYYVYLMPMQEKVAAYKADGTFNFDDPAFASYIKWFSEMGQSHAQPSWLEMTTKKYQYDSFMSGKFGMELIGTWNLANLSNLKNYPRTWKIGICPPPVPASGKGNNMHTSEGGYGININSAHPAEALQFAWNFAIDSYKYSGDIPARVDMSPDDLKALLKDMADGLSFDGITTDDLYNTIYNNGLGVCDEKIVGPASAQINAMITKELEKYFVNPEKFPLDTVIKSINDQANKLIAQDKAAK